MNKLDDLEAKAKLHHYYLECGETNGRFEVDSPKVLALIRVARAAQEIRECPLSASEGTKPVILQVHCALERWHKFGDALKALEGGE